MKFLITFILFSFNLFSFEEIIKKELSSKGIEKLWVENVNGDIEVLGYEEELILIEATKVAKKKEYLKNLNVIIEREGKTLHISTKHTRSYLLGFLPVKMGGSVKYKIFIPKNVNLDIETVNGNIFVEKVEGNIKGESVNGNLTLKEISGKGNFETVNGEIRSEILNNVPNLRVESVNGDIYIKAEKNLNANYSIEVVNGKIKLIPSIMEIKSSTPKEISGKWGKGEGEIHIETVNGDVTIEFGESNII